MNELCKERTAKKFLAAIMGCNYIHEQIALKLGIGASNYISMIKRSDQYKKIPLKAWERFRDFVNSGETIDNYNVNKYNGFKDTPANNEDLIPKPEIKAEIFQEESEGKYTLNINIVITLNGKKIVI